MKTPYKFSIATLLLAISHISNAQTSSMTELQNLTQQNPQAAYQLSQKMSATYAGQTNFDLLYADIAVKTNHLDEAQFALNRVLINEPNNAAARFSLAQIYMRQRDYLRSQQEYTTLLGNQQLSSNDRKLAQQQLSLINRILANHVAYWHAQLGLSGGYDSNANSATNTNLITLPAIGEFIIAPDQHALHSDFTDLTINANGNLPVNDTFSVFGMMNGETKNNFSAHNFDTNIVDIYAGVAAQVADDVVVKLPLAAERLWLGNSVARDLLSATLQADQTINARNNFSYYAQINRINYPNQVGQDVKNVLGGVYWGHAFPALRLALGPYYGVQSAYTVGNNFLGAHFYGINNRILFTVSNIYYPYLNINLQTTKYNGINPIYNERRRNHFYDVVAGVDWNVSRQWIINANIETTNNQEDLDFYQYRRNVVQAGVKYNFGL